MSEIRCKNEAVRGAMRGNPVSSVLPLEWAEFLDCIASPAAILTTDGKLACANNAFVKTFDGAVQLGDPLNALLPIPEHKQLLDTSLGQMLSERIPQRTIEVLTAVSEQSYSSQMLLRLSHIIPTAVQSEGFLVICESYEGKEFDDITDHSLLPSALHAAGVGIWQYNPKTDHIRFSRSAKPMLANLQGERSCSGSLESFLTLVAPDYRNLVADEFRRCAASDHAETLLRIEFPVSETVPEKWVSLRGQGLARPNSQSCELLIGILEDMTGPKLTEQALRKSDDVLRQLTENVEGVFWMRSNVDNSLLYVSPGYEKIWGRKVEELFVNPEAAVSTIHPEDLERVKEETKSDAHSQFPFTYYVEYRIIRPDGSIRWISEHAFPIFDGTGQIHRRAGLATDITEHRLAEEKLNLLRTALEAAANSIVITDKRGIIRWVNPAFLATTGYQQSDVIGKSTAMLKSGRHGRAFYDALWKTILSGQVWRGEINNMRKDGTIYQEEMTITPVRGTTGAIEHFIAIKQDISERIAASQALSQSEQKYRSLFQSAHDAIFLLRDGKIIDFNKHAESLLECSRKQIMGKTLHDFAPIRQPDGRDSQDVAEAIMRLAAEQIVLEREWKGKRWTGTLFDAEISASNVRFGSEDWIQVVVRDISERRRIEARMRQNQKLEAIGQLAGGIAHDFNNLLMVITGHLELILASMSANAYSRTHLEKARTAALHAADLTKQLLAFSRQQVMVSRIIDLSEIVSESLTLLERLIPSNISIRSSLAESKCLIKADPGQLRQIIMNLVLNARDAMPDGGSVHISTRHLEITCPLEIPSTMERLQAGHYVVLSIEDNGHGMDADTAAKIFDPFFTTKAKGRGTGLGLATVFGIVKQSGGDIAVQSKPGHGTTFTLYFPCITEESQLPSPSTKEKPQQSISQTVVPGRIFVVDDESAVRSLVSQILIAAGYKVLMAETPSEALRIAETCKLPPDLLIVDVGLPQMSGMELAAALREHWPSMKILFTSGYSDIATLNPGEFFIQKPYGSNALVLKVQSILQSSKVDNAASEA